MNAPNWKECNSWEEIKFFCENCDFTVCGFVYDGIKMVITKNYGKITLNIGDYTNSSLSSIINNLPENIDDLVVSIATSAETKFLEKIFINLPFTLKKIKFIYKGSKISEIKSMESDGKFNVLFGIKFPFSCDFIVNYDNVDYEAKYIDPENELELKKKKQIFKIKYTKPKPQNQNGNANYFGGGGGLMQLAAYGAQDIYLTGNPQITFFKFTYRPNNFSIVTPHIEKSRNFINKREKKDKFLESNRYQKSLFTKQNRNVKTNYR